MPKPHSQRCWINWYGVRPGHRDVNCNCETAWKGPLEIWYDKFKVKPGSNLSVYMCLSSPAVFSYMGGIVLLPSKDITARERQGIRQWMSESNYNDWPWNLSWVRNREKIRGERFSEKVLLSRSSGVEGQLGGDTVGRESAGKVGGGQSVECMKLRLWRGCSYW